MNPMGKGRWIWLFLGIWSAAFGQAKIKFEKTKHDFGEIKEEEGIAETIFKFQNTGNKSLILESVKASCGCTTPIWSRDSIAPGFYGFIKVEYNPSGRPGIFNKEIYVESNSAPGQVQLHISGKVSPRPKGPEDYYPFEEGVLRFRTNHLTFGTLSDDEIKTESTVLYNQGKKTIQFSKSGSKVPGHLKPKMSKSSLAPGDTLTLWISYNAALKKDFGLVQDNIFLMTNDASQPVKRIAVTADIREEFSAEEKAHAGRASFVRTSQDLGLITEGEHPEASFELKNTGKGPLSIRRLSAACSCISLKGCKDLAPGESCEIKMIFDSNGRVGEFEKDAIIILNDPVQDEYHLEIKGKVVRERSGEQE